jgi:hypothetical protein
MPIIDIFVDRVTPTVLSDTLTSYLVDGRPTDGSLGGFQATTVNALRASICERARAIQRPVRIGWGDAPSGRFGRGPGKRIVDVQLLDAEVF